MRLDLMKTPDGLGIKTKRHWDQGGIDRPNRGPLERPWNVQLHGEAAG